MGELSERQYELLKADLLEVTKEYDQFLSMPEEGEVGLNCEHGNMWRCCERVCVCGHSCAMHVSVGDNEPGAFDMCCAPGCHCRKSMEGG